MSRCPGLLCDGKDRAGQGIEFEQILNVKLQSKFILTLVSAIVIGLIAAQTTQQFFSNKALKRLSVDNLAVLEKRESTSAANLSHTLDTMIGEAIARGEMQELDELLAKFSGLDGVTEYSIYDHEGVASYSTERSIVKSHATLPSDLKQGLLSSPAKISRQTDTAFETFTPLPVTAKCMECHDDFRAGAVGGVAVLRLSTATLRSSSTNWIAATTGMQKDNRTIGASATLGIAAVFALLIYLTVRALVTRPLDTIIVQLKQNACQLQAASAEITSHSQTLAQSVSEQAASLEETSASMEEMSSMTARNASSAGTANEIARQTRQATTQSIRDMQDLTQTNGAIKTASHDVSKILKTIDEIAFQTNILALNAAVEAARAGNSGLGFSVVADEVRALAGRCAEASRETAVKITAAISNSAQGVEVSAKVSLALNEIDAKARQMDELAAAVSTASKEQSLGITQISTAVAEMDKLTQSNAATAEEVAAAAHQLAAQADETYNAVAALLKLVGGHAGEFESEEGAKISRHPNRISQLLHSKMSDSTPADPIVN